ncbi:MAG: hypothetical protein AAF628_18415 [Planctomycetota bacterium]
MQTPAEIPAAGTAPLRPLVVFDSGHLIERGTDVALWDYAHFNETLLGNRSVIACPAQAPIPCVDRFRERFSVVLYRDRTDLEWVLRDAALYYTIAHGHPSGAPLSRPPRGRTAVHCVFRCDRPHGDVYAAVSDWVADHRGLEGAPRVPVVPHMIHLDDGDGTNLRAELGIPPHAVVLGRHGGPSTFDLPFVHATVSELVKHRDDLWFLMWNTQPFCPPHPRIVHLPPTPDPRFKVRFIDACDAMLHARREGETFGLAVGEFSVRGKPVLTWGGSSDRHHLDVLGDRAIVYHEVEDLAEQLLLWRGPPPPPAGGWDAFSARFGPEPVMRAFARVFLASAATLGRPIPTPAPAQASEAARPPRRSGLRISSR